MHSTIKFRYAHWKRVINMAQKRMGRPPLEKPLRDRIFVLVNDEIKEKLATCRETLNTTTSDIVRQGINRIYDDLKNK